MQINNDSLQLNAHEQLIDELGTMLLHIDALQDVLRQDSPDITALHGGLNSLERLTQTLIDELRNTDNDLPVAELVGITLTEAMSRAVEEIAETLGLSSRITFNGEEHPLPASSERLLYRIAQEALYQVQQHINTHRIRLTFSYGHDDVQMVIEDDGTVPKTNAEVPIPHFIDNHATAANSQAPLPYFRDETLNETLSPVFQTLRHRIEHMGGILEVNGQLEQGMRVQVRLPYTLPERQTNETAQPTGIASTAPITPPHPQSPSSPITSETAPIRVLVVDGQAVSRAGLRHLLATYADLHVIGEAADGVQAVSETLELGPQVVLMDANLPNGQSADAVRQIKQLHLDTRVLLLSVQQREELLYEMLRAGADGYVLKDILPDELAQAVRAVARGEMLVQQQLAGRLLSRFGKPGKGSYPYESLTEREQDVLRLLARGLRNKEIAARLYVSERTVTFHLANIYQKLNVSGRTEALSKALEQGLITA
jgi:DNA-binding NarL/FixJ family response regulator